MTVYLPKFGPPWTYLPQAAANRGEGMMRIDTSVTVDKEGNYTRKTICFCRYCGGEMPFTWQVELELENNPMVLHKACRFDYWKHMADLCAHTKAAREKHPYLTRLLRFFGYIKD